MPARSHGDTCAPKVNNIRLRLREVTDEPVLIYDGSEGLEQLTVLFLDLKELHTT